MLIQPCNWYRENYTIKSTVDAVKFSNTIQGSKLAVAHGNQNVTWATWKRRKIAQLAIKNSSSPIFVRLYRDRFSVTCSTEMFLTQRNISYGFSNREPECVVNKIILWLRNTLNFGKFPKFKSYQCGRKAYGRIREINCYCLNYSMSSIY